MVRERLADIYRQQGHGRGRAARAGAVRRTNSSAAGELEETLPALRRIVGLHPDNIAVAHPAGGDRVAGRQGRRGVHELSPAGGAGEGAGARSTISCASRSGCCSTARRLRRRARAGGGVHRAQEPAAGADQAADGAEGGAARSPERHAAGRGAGPAGSRPRRSPCGASWRSCTTPPGARTIATPRCARRWPSTGPTARRASWPARWGVTVSAVKPRMTPPPLPAGISGARPRPGPRRSRRRIAPGRCRASPGWASRRISGISAISASSGLTPGPTEVQRACSRRPTCS